MCLTVAALTKSLKREKVKKVNLITSPHCFVLNLGFSLIRFHVSLMTTNQVIFYRLSAPT